MCTDCNELTIPKGDDGVNGTNGTSILCSGNRLTVTSGSGTTETSLFTCSIPANSFETNGDQIEIFTYFRYVSTDPIDITFKLGGVVMYTFTQEAASEEKFTIRIKLAKVNDLDAQFGSIEKIGYILSGSVPTTFIDEVGTSIDPTIANTLEITATNSVAGANQLRLRQVTTYLYKV